MREKYFNLLFFCLLLCSGKAFSQTAGDDAVSTLEDTPVVITVLQNDSFGEYGAGAVPIMIAQQATNGSVDVITNGTPEDPTDDVILYTPNTGFFGNDMFVYTIYDSVSNTSSANVFITVGSCSGSGPIPTQDDYITILETEISCFVLANDTFNAGGLSGLSISVGPAHGTATVQTNATVTVTDDYIKYAPDAGFLGADTLQYTVTDCSGLTATGTVTISVVEDTTLTVVDDHGSVSQFVSGNTVISNILGNDTIGGNAASLATVTIMQLSTTNPNFNIDTATGAAILEPGTPTQHYVIAYQICEIAHPENCAIGKVALLSAGNDFENQVILVSPCHATFTDNVFSNDSYYGQPIIYGEDNVNNNNVTVNTSSDSGQVYTQMPIAGVVVLYNIENENTADMISYQICDTVNPEICDYGTFPVTIDNQTMFAHDDDFSGTPISNVTGSDTQQSVFLNDLNCANPLDLGSFYVSAVNFPAGISLNFDGTIHVAEGTSPGTYVFDYSICSNQWNDCSTAQVTVLIDDVLKTPDFIFRNITVAPNPVVGMLSVSGVAAIERISILSLLGQELKTVKGIGLQQKVDFSDFTQGTYIVKVTSGGVEKTFKAIKN